MVLQRSNARIISPERKKLLMQAVKVSAENGRVRALQATKKMIFALDGKPCKDK